MQFSDRLQMRDEFDRLTSRVAKLEAGVQQILDVCDDNESASDRLLALTFIRDVAASLVKD
jgi:hypothetical protein